MYHITSVSDLITIPSTEIDASFSYVGCYVDDDHRAMGDMDDLATYGDLGMHATAQVCADFCRDNGYHYFGLQYYNQCFCDNEYDMYGVAAADSECNTPCYGDDTTMCGGPWRNSVYRINE